MNFFFRPKDLNIINIGYKRYIANKAFIVNINYIIYRSDIS